MFLEGGTPCRRAPNINTNPYQPFAVEGKAPQAMSSWMGGGEGAAQAESSLGSGQVGG